MPWHQYQRCIHPCRIGQQFPWQRRYGWMSNRWRRRHPQRRSRRIQPRLHSRGRWWFGVPYTWPWCGQIGWVVEAFQGWIGGMWWRGSCEGKKIENRCMVRNWRWKIMQFDMSRLCWLLSVAVNEYCSSSSRIIHPPGVYCVEKSIRKSYPPPTSFCTSCVQAQKKNCGSSGSMA